MKRSEAFKALRAGALGLTLAALVSAAPAQAQNSNNNNSGGAATTNRAEDRRDDNRNDNRRVVREDDDRDWGWLGLLGLAGLLGLMPKKRVPVVVNETRERDVVRDPDPRDRR